MLTNQTISQIKQTILSDPRFIEKMSQAQISTSKEVGHDMYQGIENLVCQILIESMGAISPTKDRDLADVILENNLLNIKFGVPKMKKSGKAKYGQPNMCSMKKIIKAFFSTSKIDSYYIIKISVLPTSYSVHVFDMFDYHDYLTYNGGPGQIMIQEEKFYKDVDTFVPQSTIEEKKTKLNSIYENGLAKHIVRKIEQLIKHNPSLKSLLREKLLPILS